MPVIVSTPHLSLSGSDPVWPAITQPLSWWFDWNHDWHTSSAPLCFSHPLSFTLFFCPLVSCLISRLLLCHSYQIIVCKWPVLIITELVRNYTLQWHTFPYKYWCVNLYIDLHACSYALTYTQILSETYRFRLFFMGQRRSTADENWSWYLLI